MIEMASNSVSLTLFRLSRQSWPVLLNGFLLLLFCWFLAQWTWRLFLPAEYRRTVALETLSVAPAARLIESRHLFGQAERGYVTEAFSDATAHVNLRLYGVFSAIGSLPAFAIIGSDGQTAKPVQEGKEVERGVMLGKVFPEYVLLDRGGVSERLDLESAHPKASGAVVPAEFKLNVEATGSNTFKFSRNELDRALQDSAQFGKMGKISHHPGGGMLVEEASAGSLSNKLGLEAGDVISGFNGQKVNSNEDVQKILGKLGSGQAWLDLTRAGRPMQLRYLIQQ